MLQQIREPKEMDGKVKSQDQANNLNKPLTQKEIEHSLKLHKQEGPEPDGFSIVLYLTFNKELTLKLL